MKKAIVIGCPGSGKSTFSKSLHKITKIPLSHLDMILWNADKTTVEKPVFLDRLFKIIHKYKNIYDSPLNLFIFIYKDTLYFLHYKPCAITSNHWFWRIFCSIN